MFNEHLLIWRKTCNPFFYLIHHYVITFCQWLAAGLQSSLGTLVSSTNKTDLHNITEILLKVVLNTITLNPLPSILIIIVIVLPCFFLRYWRRRFSGTCSRSSWCSGTPLGRSLRYFRCQGIRLLTFF